MSYGALKRKSRRAERNMSRLCLALCKLSSTTLTPAGQAQLPGLRMAAHKAIQYAFRLRRRLAKVKGNADLPGLSRAKFKRASTVKRIEKLHGSEAALAYLMSITTQ